MDVLRNLIIERINKTSCACGHCHLVQDALYYLIDLGVSPDEAMRAMDHFIEDVIAAKARHRERVT